MAPSATDLKNRRMVFEQIVEFKPSVENWIDYAKFELENGEIGKCRNVFERAVDKVLGNLSLEKEIDVLLLEFAQFEKHSEEPARAREIYKIALQAITSHTPEERAKNFYKKFFKFAMLNGYDEEIDNIVLLRLRRIYYEAKAKENGHDYDNWFDYIHLEETLGNKDTTREVYERAVANIPIEEEKKHWSRYIYLWIRYALYEEGIAKDMERTREVYRVCLRIIPHEKFSFAKIWILAAKFEIRQLNLSAARNILGTAIGTAPKDKIFKAYIDIEKRLGNLERCRKLYKKYLDWAPENCSAWCKYADLEASQCELERARNVFELAICQPALDKPESLWKQYIEFEKSTGEFGKVRALFERLLERTKHLKIWISYGRFEAYATNAKCILPSRRVFENANNYFRTCCPERKEEREMLLKEWLAVEDSFGEKGDTSLVQKKLPKKVKSRKIVVEDGSIGSEEYIDYQFPEDT